MKKMITILLASALVLGLLITGTLAAGHFGHGTGICQNSGACYQDADGDEICDYHGSNCAYVDTDGDGVCDNLGQNCGQSHHGGGHHREAAGINEVKG